MTSNLTERDVTDLIEGLAVALQDQLGYDTAYSEKVAGFLARDRDVHFSIHRIIKRHEGE